MTRKLNEASEQLIKQWEACILYAYDDFDPPSNRRRIKAGDRIKGTLTIGYGHTGPDVRPGMTITPAQAEALFDRDVGKACDIVERGVKVPLNDNQFGALTAFVHNIGPKQFNSSTLLKKLNAGDYDAVPAELMKWVKSKGKRRQGLVNRRSAEAGLWAKGSFVQSAGSPVDKERAPLINGKVAATASAVVSSGALAYVPQTGPLAYVLAGVLAVACLVGIGLYVWDRVKN
jgi:lysozyme